MATPEITNAQTLQFSASVELKVQLMMSRLLKAVDIGNYTGRGGEIIKQIGSLEMSEVTSSNADTVYTDIPHDDRWVYPTPYAVATILDDFDIAKSIADFKSPIVQAVAAAEARKIEYTIAQAFFSDAKTGKEGATTTSFLASQQVGVDVGAAAATGMNVAKILKGKEVLKSTYAIMPGDEVWVAITARQENDLLKEVQFSSGDYNPNNPMRNAEVESHLGVNFIVTQELPKDGSNYRRCPMWVKRGMHLGRWLTTRKIVQDPGKWDNWSVRSKLMLGASRTQETLVAEIKCSEA